MEEEEKKRKEQARIELEKKKAEFERMKLEAYYKTPEGIAKREAEEAEAARRKAEAARRKAEEAAKAIKLLEQAKKNKDIDGILAVMAQHRDSTEVQQWGCCALGWVADTNDANRRTIAKKGGIEAVFRAMTQHSHHEDVQSNGCFMMYKMVKCESARPAIREGKAVMDAARNNFPNNGMIKRYLDDVYAKI